MPGFSVFFIASLLLTICESGYILTVNMDLFSNPDNKGLNGHCCDSFEVWGCSVVKCDFEFNFCLETMQNWSPELTSCKTKWLETGHVATDVTTFLFKERQYGAWKNPHKITVSDPWLGFVFKIQALDYDSVNPDDPIDNLMLKFNSSWAVGQRHEISVHHPRLKAGPTDTKFSFSVQCDSSSHGPYCESGQSTLSTTTPVTLPPTGSTTCAELRKAGKSSSGIYELKILVAGQIQQFQAYCDMETDGGGWTVIQRQSSFNKLFNNTWDNFEQGFNDDPNLVKNLWLGNKQIHWLTAAQEMALRVDLMDCTNQSYYEYYPMFKIGDASTNYQLSITEGQDVIGTAGNSISTGQANLNQNGAEFSTLDRDNDKLNAVHCTDYFPGGWWYNACGLSNLNGLYYSTCDYTSTFYDGIYWFTWKKGQYSAKRVEMKLRRVDFHSF